MQSIDWGSIMQTRWSRYASLTGVAFFVIVLVALITGGGETPDGNARPLVVISYYSVHRSEIELSSVLLVFAALFLVLWTASLRSYLRREPAAEGPSALALAGGAMAGIGATILASLEYGLAHELGHLGPQSAQTLNLLDNVLFLPFVLGILLLALGGGVAIVRSGLLPRWLGWVGVVVAILAAIPPIGFAALLAFVLWTLVTSVLVYLRCDAQPSSDAEKRTQSRPLEHIPVT